MSGSAHPMGEVSGGSNPPRVVAIGGGHGLATALAAARRYAGEVSAVVSVADDGGSSGRLVAEFEILPPGDMRKCLVALAEPGNTWADAFEFRFPSGELSGHALGNLILVGLAEVLGGFPAALRVAESLLGCEGRVLPATTERVTLLAETDAGEVKGQAQIAKADSRIRRIRLDPLPEAHPDAVAAIEEADQILIGPGSLYTSILPPFAVPGIAVAVEKAKGTRICICNLAAQPGETDGFDLGDHVEALADHGVEFDVCLYEPWEEQPMPTGGVRAENLAKSAGMLAPSRLASVGNPARHDPERLAAALAHLV